MDVNWSQLILSETFFQRLSSQARRHIVDDVVADQAVTYVIETLSANQWEKCQTYNGKSTPETFLYSLCSNLVIDYSRKYYGRQRPPSWLQRNGPLWLAIWKELCINRADRETVIMRHTADGSHSRTVIETIITGITARLPWCGVSSRPESIDDDNYHDHYDELTTSHESNDREGFDDALEFANLVLNESGDSSNLEGMSSVDPSSLYDVFKNLQLTPEEKLILKMHYCDGLNFSAIARALGMAKHQPVRLIEKVLERARKLLKEYGID